MELRCANGILHGIINGDEVEVSCRSSRCGKKPGTIVLHKFNKTTGELLDTRIFAEPTKGMNRNGTRPNKSTAIRTS